MFGDLLARIGACLLRNNVPYMIIGGQALMLYSEPRLTHDIDIMLGIDVRCLNLLLFIVNELRLKVIPDDPKAFVKQTMVLPALEESTGLRVDFIISSTPYEKEAIDRAVRIRVMDQIVRFSTPEDLIIHKVITGNHFDLDDVRKILSRSLELNLSLIRRTLKNFDSALPGNRFLVIFEDELKKSGQNTGPEQKKNSSWPLPPGADF